MPTADVTVQNHKTFAKDGLIWLQIIIIFQSILIAGLLGFILLQLLSNPKPGYFLMKKGDQLTDRVPLEQPLLTDAELLNWSTQAMIASFSFNYHNYAKITDKVEEYFDPLGLNSYFNMLSSHPNIQEVVQKKLVLSGRPTAAPRIVKDGVVDGRYAWEIALPFILKFRNQQFNLDLELELDLLVVRVPEQAAPLGVKIVKIQEYKDPNFNK